VVTRLVFETHSWSEDNERGIATGWLPGRLSSRGRDAARELGQRRRTDGLAAVFSSDLRRAIETADEALGSSGLPILYDWRLRECDYGRLNGAGADEVHGERLRYLSSPYPGGESWEEAVERVGRFLRDLPSRWTGARVLVIGHLATRCAFEHHLNRRPLAEVVGARFQWQEGWEYELDSSWPEPGSGARS